jgi:DNA recombination protein RmuC
MSNEILIFSAVILISILITYIVVRLVYEKRLSTLVYEKESMQKEILQRLEFEKIRYEESKKAMNSEFRIRVESYDEKLQLLEDSKKQMKLEFESLANKLFEENSKKVITKSKSSIKSL